MRKMKIRRYLATGLLVWIPLGVTLLLLRILINFMDGLIPTPLRPENLFGFRIPGLGVILTFTLLLVTGFFAANLLGKKLIAVWEALLARRQESRGDSFVTTQRVVPKSAPHGVPAKRNLEPLLPNVERSG